MAGAAIKILRQWSESLGLDYAEAASVLAGCARAEGKLADAQRYATEAWGAAASGRPRGDWMVASKELRVARCLVAEGMNAQAEELLESAYKVLHAQLGDQHTETGLARELFRDLYTNWGRPEDAARYAEPASSVELNP